MGVAITATAIIAQIIYTMTLEKLQPIALLKLIGAPTRTIVGLVIEESLALGVIAYAIALGHFTYACGRASCWSSSAIS